MKSSGIGAKMIDYFNPFEYETANKLSEEKICDFYIEDYNYSRFIRSKRNIFLVGARGTGKTMTLLYNSLPVQIYKAKKDKKKLIYHLFAFMSPVTQL
jgi:predicted AAA+ superfamily ATPase